MKRLGGKTRRIEALSIEIVTQSHEPLARHPKYKGIGTEIEGRVASMDRSMVVWTDKYEIG